MNNKNQKLINIYFIVVIVILVLISVVQIATALKIGKMAELTPKQILLLHKAADIDRVYQGHEVLIMQRLGGGLFYFLLAIFVAIQFYMAKVVDRWKSTNNKKPHNQTLENRCA